MQRDFRSDLSSIASRKAIPSTSSPGDRLKELITFNASRFTRISGPCTTSASASSAAKPSASWAKTAAAKSTLPAAHRRHPAAYSRYGGGGRPCFGAAGTGRRIQSGIQRARQCISQRLDFSASSTREIDERYGDIAAFAEIGDFINRPVKLIRVAWWCCLAFAVAIHVDPEVLLVTSVGRWWTCTSASAVCAKWHEMRARGVTIVFVSHSAAERESPGRPHAVAGWRRVSKSAQPAA